MIFGKRVLVLLAVGIFSLLGAAATEAEIYKWVDGQGNIHFQDHPPQAAGKISDLEVRDSSPSLPRELTPAPPAAAGNQGQAAAAKSPVKSQQASPRTMRVELYTVAWCPWCKKAREYFRSLGVPFTDYDVEKEPLAAARKDELDPQKGVPFAIVNGVKIHGYSPEAYSRALASPAPGNP